MFCSGFFWFFWVFFKYQVCSHCSVRIFLVNFLSDQCCQTLNIVTDAVKLFRKCQVFSRRGAIMLKKNVLEIR